MKLVKEIGKTVAIYTVWRIATVNVERMIDEIDRHYNMKRIKKEQKRAKAANVDLIVVQDGKEFCVVL